MRLRIASALLALAVVGCDLSSGATIRNDLGQDVVLKIGFGSDELMDAGAGPLRPGRFISIAKVGLPGERPSLLLKAFDVQGALVFCQRLEYDAYRNTSETAPISIRSGQLTCS